MAFKKGHHPKTEFKKGSHGFTGKHTKESKKKMSKNSAHFWLGKHFSEETKRKMSEVQKGKKLSEETKKKLSIANKGQIPWIKGKHHTEKVKRESSERNKGMVGYWKGKKLSKETIKKLSEAKQRARHWNWQGGITNNPYSINWTRTLRRSIRERDNYTCQLCGKEPVVHVHHIDYDKNNCDPNNLITLCLVCHCKTNFNRKYWIRLFKK